LFSDRLRWSWRICVEREDFGQDALAFLVHSGLGHKPFAVGDMAYLDETP
jgi:hypothetical protein